MDTRSRQRVSRRSESKLAGLIREMRRRLSPDPRAPISQQRLAELLEVSWSSVARWEGGREPDRKLAEKIRRLHALLESMGDFVLPEARLAFLEERHPMLNDMRPIDLLDSRYGVEAVMNLIERARTGAFA